MNIEQITVNLGNEYDDKLRNALRTVLISNGVTEIDKSWGVGGSQEVETLKVKLGNNLILVESETYVGLTITGPKLVTENLAEQVHEQLQRPK